jgi:hypothetical protein
MAALNPPPEQTLLILHPYQKFLTDHADTISLPQTIRTKLYDFINQSVPPPTLDIIKNHFPYLPHTLLVEALKSTQPLLGYLPSPMVVTIVSARTQVRPCGRSCASARTRKK